MKKEKPIVEIVITGLDKPTRSRINKIQSYLIRTSSQIDEDFINKEKYAKTIRFRLF